LDGLFHLVLRSETVVRVLLYRTNTPMNLFSGSEARTSASRSTNSNFLVDDGPCCKASLLEDLLEDSVAAALTVHLGNTHVRSGPSVASSFLRSLQTLARMPASCLGGAVVTRVEN
jgi:hypothetical protein